MASEREALALLLLQARHPDNPDRPLPMVRAGCAQLLADAILAAGWQHPDDEVLVEGSWFARPDLPVILGNFMRRCDEYGREAKALAATVQRVRALVFSEQANEFRREAAFGMTRLPYANNRYLRLLDDLRAALTAPPGPAAPGGHGEGRA